MSKIVIYGTPNCPYCELTKKYMSRKGEEYIYIDITKDENALNLIREKTGQLGVPVININGKYILGYNVSKIDIALDQG